MFLSRCLIYKVHALAFRPAVLFILAHSFSLVKCFFQKFFNFLPKHSHSSFVRPFEELVHFTTLFRACQELFSRLSAVFTPLCLDFKLFSEPFRVSCELVYFNTRIPLCQALFFRSLSEVRPGSPRFLPSFLLFSCPLAKCWIIISVSSLFVNTLFQISLIFLREAPDSC